MNISRAQCSPAAGSVFQRASDIKSNSKRFFHDLSLLVIVCLRVRQPETAGGIGSLLSSPRRPKRRMFLSAIALILIKAL